MSGGINGSSAQGNTQANTAGNASGGNYDSSSAMTDFRNTVAEVTQENMKNRAEFMKAGVVVQASKEKPYG